MGIKLEWPVLYAKDATLLTVLPVDTVWPDPNLPRMEIVLSDQTASVQHMNFTGCGDIYTSGFEFRTRLLKKFVRENLVYKPHTLILLWDKPWTTPRRQEMYSKKRYHVPDPAEPVPSGKVRGVDGRIYRPGHEPLPAFNPLTGLGLKAELAITETKMEPLPQLLASSWTKIVLAQFICHSLWDFAVGREEHFIFDTPMVEGDWLCTGGIRCNRPECESCPLLNVNMPRHGEADLLFLYHIRASRLQLSPEGRFLVRGTNDRDLLAVLSFPLDPGLSDLVWWCKGTNNYGMSARGTWEKPGPLTGAPTNCHEYISMAKVVGLFGGADLLLTRLMILFLFGGDYCDIPRGFTAAGLAHALFTQGVSFLSFKEGGDEGGEEGEGVDKKGLVLDMVELRHFVALARERSSKCRTKVVLNDLVKCVLDAVYSVAYYTGMYGEVAMGQPVGPILSSFGYGPDFVFKERDEWRELFRDLDKPLVVGMGERKEWVYRY
jgi:hypothetical protein